MDDKEINENKKEIDNNNDSIDIINIDVEQKKIENENENKIETIEEDENINPKTQKDKEERHFSLEGAKLPLSKYTRRIFNTSLLKDYLNENSSAGICGSYNLGNTCFMNSSIACISNCTELTYYFLSEQYKKEINYDSKYGLKGKLAESWFELLYKYWVENTKTGNPKDFKDTIGEKDIRFKGYNQQDSNEFINIFLDTLNEDLNFSDEKKYIELEEKSEKENDEQCAKRFWEANLIRNDSVITDLFCGLFKSTITCPKCKGVSVTFEPFYSINLPLKENKNKKMKTNDIEKKDLEEYQIFYIPIYGIRSTICSKFLDISTIAQVKDCIELLKNNENFIYKNIMKNFKCFKIHDLDDQLEIDEDSFIDEKYKIMLYEINNNNGIDQIKVPIFFIYSKPDGVLALSQYFRLICCEKYISLNSFRKQIYISVRKYILSPFINFENQRIDNLSLEIEKYRKDMSIDDELILNLIEEEYEKIYNENHSEEEFIYLYDYIQNIPYRITLRELKGIRTIPVFEENKLNELSEEFKNLTEAYDINDCFNEILGRIEGFVVCIEFRCNSKFFNKRNYKFDSFNVINIQYPKILDEKKEEEKKEEEKEEEEKYHKQNLVECFNNFCKEEQLKTGNEWYCSKCKEHLLAKKKLDLYYLPKILIISFKRFIKDSHQWEKNSEYVDFPINNFDMKDLIIGPDKDHSIYDLFAVSQHYGGTGFGHYTAVCKNGDKWYNYDDSSVTETSKNACLSSAAYVLFYRRKTD